MGGDPLPHPLTSVSPPAPEPHGPPGWLKRKAGSHHPREHGVPQLPYTHMLWEALPTGPAPVQTGQAEIEKRIERGKWMERGKRTERGKSSSISSHSRDTELHRSDTHQTPTKS